MVWTETLIFEQQHLEVSNVRRKVPQIIHGYCSSHSPTIKAIWVSPWPHECGHLSNVFNTCGARRFVRPKGAEKCWLKAWELGQGAIIWWWSFLYSYISIDISIQINIRIYDIYIYLDIDIDIDSDTNIDIYVCLYVCIHVAGGYLIVGQSLYIGDYWCYLWE